MRLYFFSNRVDVQFDLMQFKFLIASDTYNLTRLVLDIVLKILIHWQIKYL